MLKRSDFLSLAAGLLASLAFATPSRAGSVATTYVEIMAPAVATSTDVEITYTSAPSAPTYLGSTTVSPSSYSISGDMLTINYAPIKGNQELDFTFASSDPSITFTADKLTGVAGLPSGEPEGLLVSVVPPSVPEPTSLALLGIGLSGCDRAGAKDYAAFLGFFSLELP